MKKNFLYYTIFIGASCFYSSYGAAANHPSNWHRCTQDDWLSDEKAKGRIAWAYKCDYISEERKTLCNQFRLYPTYIHNNGSLQAPTDPEAPCDEGWNRYLVFCQWGCYTPDQNLLFDGKYMPIGEARMNQSTVTGLAKNSILNDLQFEEKKLQAFVSGETSETIYRIVTADGTLKVTKTHPVVRSDGSIAKAADIKKGDKLLTRFGNPTTVNKVEPFEYKGEVINVRPESDSKIENIVVAEDILNGSIKFQNEWIDTDFRIEMRLK